MKKDLHILDVDKEASPKI